MIKKFGKLGAKTVQRFLTLADENFVDDVNDDIKCFLLQQKVNRVLAFPPVSNYRRFLIHKCVEEAQGSQLATFSIGVGDERRTIVCYKEQLLSDVACAKPAMGLSQADREDDSLRRDDGECKRPARAQPQEKIRPASTKPRRPDRAVYVPRALRNSEPVASVEKPLGEKPSVENPPDTRKRTGQTPPAPQAKCPKSPRDQSLPGTPRKDKNFCNVYTPPHLRSGNQKSESELPCDSAISDSSDEASTFYIGDYFANGQLGLYTPNVYYSENTEGRDKGRVDCLVYPEDWSATMGTETGTNIIENYSLSYDKDEEERNELRRASEEINKSNKRIIKQNFHSDVLVISDPVEEPEVVEPVKEPLKPSPVIEKQKLEPRLSLKREENDWDAVFDDSGECLDPSLLEELTATVGKVQISKAKNNYDQYQTRGQALFNGPIDETFAHVVEVYDFPSEFKTNDLLAVFSEFKDQGFEIKWVDDTHALIVFSSAKIAAEVLSSNKPLVRCRPLHAATAESRNKAKKCAEFLQPYRPRPATCAALARRLVSGALGVRLGSAQWERAEERRVLSAAREKKRQAALHKEAAWDGSLAHAPLPDT